MSYRKTSKYWYSKVRANSADHDQQSDQGLHRLLWVGGGGGAWVAVGRYCWIPFSAGAFY